MELHYFMAVFHEVAGRKVKGEASEIVKTCIQLLPEVRFKTV